MDRLKYIFSEFDNVYVSFSGGKDSGLLLNIVIDYLKKNCPGRRVGVFHQDLDRKSTRLNSSHSGETRMPSSA